MSKPVPNNSPSELLTLYQIEKQIVEYDQDAKADGVVFTDSQVRSVLTKVRTSLEGGAPKLPDVSARDRLLGELHATLVALSSDPFGGSGNGENELENLPIGKWLAAIRQVEGSIRRHSTGAGSRAYLDFVEGFMAKEGI